MRARLLWRMIERVFGEGRFVGEMVDGVVLPLLVVLLDCYVDALTRSDSGIKILYTGEVEECCIYACLSIRNAAQARKLRAWTRSVVYQSWKTFPIWRKDERC